VTLSRADRERLGALLALASFAALLGALLGRHEMWRDELQAWMLARDSGSIADLWRNTRYEGHPLLWHLLLLAPAHLFASPAAMQALHWLVATSAAAVVLLRAPFSLPVRVLLVFSYLPLFEYGVVSRNYALTVLGLWLACAGLASSRSAWPTVAAASLAANASPLGIVLAPAIGAAIALTPAWRRRRALPLAVLAAGVAVAAWQCLPPSDYEHAREWVWSLGAERVAYVLRGYAVALIPVPADELHFWGSSALLPAYPFPADNVGSIAAFAGVLVALAVAVVAQAVRPSARALAAWLVGVASLLLFSYVKLPGALRHHGFLWVLAVACLWLAAADGAVGRRRQTLLLAPLLVVGVWAAAIAAWRDWREPFSGARCAAEEIRRQGLDRLPVVGSPDYAVSAVAGYLPRGKLFYPASRREGSFVIWNLERAGQNALTQSEVVAVAKARDRGEGVVLLLNERLAAGLAGTCRETVHCGPAIVGDEELWGYLCGGPSTVR
jgi:hypothetical protein